MFSTGMKFTIYFQEQALWDDYPPKLQAGKPHRLESYSADRMKNSLCILSRKGETLPVYKDLLQEGIPVSIYLHDLRYANSYKNILARTGLDDLVAAIKKAEVICIDTIVKNRRNHRDLALLDKFNISHNVPDLYGRLGDILRKPPWSKEVIGGGEEVAQYELNRAKGIEFARKVGFSIPPYQEFKAIKEAVRFLQSSEGQKREKWYFKADDNLALDLTFDGTPAQLIDYLTNKVPKRLGTDAVNCVLQQAVEGDVAELDREVWKAPDGKLGPFSSTLEDKKRDSRKSGPRVGSAVNTVWLDSDPAKTIYKQIVVAAGLLRGYCGPISANCIITPDLKAWFLEWTLRFGYSALFLLLKFIMKGKLGNFFLNPFQTVWKEGFVASQVLSLAPFPPTENNRKDFEEMIVGNLITSKFTESDFNWLDVLEDSMGNFRVAGNDGLIGVGLCHDADMEAAIGKAFKKVDGIELTGFKQYWPLQEHLDSHLDRYRKLLRWGAI